MDETPTPAEQSRGASAGRRLGDFVRRARTSGAPEAERLARQARQVAESNLPHVKRASQQALSGAQRFAQDHDDEFRQAGLQAARMLASRSVPLPLQPVVAAATNDIARRSATPAKPADAAPAGVPPSEAERPARDESGPLIF